MFNNLLWSAVICVLATIFYLQPSPTLSPVSLPDPANTTNIPHIVHLKKDTVDHIRGVVGGESLVEHQGDLVTGSLDGYLVGVDPETLNIKWKVKCPTSRSGSGCRVLGLRSVGRALFGLDVNGRLFKYQSEKFEWLIDNSTPGIAVLTPGFFNDLVVYQDMIYLTDSYSLKEDRHQSMLQRFFSLQPEGKIISYNITSKEVSVLADKLFVPNGIELHRNNRLTELY